MIENNLINFNIMATLETLHQRIWRLGYQGNRHFVQERKILLPDTEDFQYKDDNSEVQLTSISAYAFKVHRGQEIKSIRVRAHYKEEDKEYDKALYLYDIPFGTMERVIRFVHAKW